LPDGANFLVELSATFESRANIPDIIPESISMDRLAVMEAFVRVVETGSFSAAARHLNVGQPAVSKSIAQLEGRLGVRLLMRSTHGLTPTEAGQNFCERARRAIEEADEADLAARGTDRSLVGCLRISTGVTFGRQHLVPLLPVFLAAHPNLSIDLILDDRTIDLIKEGIDVGLRFGPLPKSALTVSKVATSRRLVVGAPAYFERAGVPTTPAELAGHAAVIYTQDRGGTDTWSFRQGGSEMSVSISGRLRVSASEGLRAAILGGMGLAVTSQWIFAPELACGAVRAVLAEWILPASDLWAVFPTGRMASAKARAFVAFVKAELHKQQSLDRNDEHEICPPAENRRRQLAFTSHRWHEAMEATARMV
jgi:DNA-binding transcriptional LysR family regulator